MNAHNKTKQELIHELLVLKEENISLTRLKEKRASELILANKDFAFQNRVKEKEAAELISLIQQYVI